MQENKYNILTDEEMVKHICYCNYYKKYPKYNVCVPHRFDYDEFEKSNSIVLNELSRAIQFGTWAENPSCITDLKLISIDYGIDYRDYVTGGTEDVEDN